MQKVKIFLRKYFKHFSYFYSYLRYRVFISLALSLLVGILDGFGLAMFLPLLQMVNGSQENVDNEQLGNMSFLIDAISSLGIPFNLYSVLIIILFFFSIKGIVKFIEGYLRVVYQQFFIKKIRITNIDNLSTFSYSNFVKADTGRIQNSFTGEVERVNAAYKSYFMAIQAVVLVLVYVVLAFLSNPKFALLITIGGGSSNLLFKRLYAITKKRSRQLTSEMHVFHNLLIQKVHNFKYLKATALIDRYSRKLILSIDQIETSQRVIGVLNAILQALREPISMLIVVIVIIIQVKFFEGSIGVIILSLLFFYRALTFLMTVQNYWNKFIGASGSMENMTEFSYELKEGTENFGEVHFEGVKENIILDNISFSYPNKRILNKVSFSIGKNQSIAIVGESGSGKTTLINVLIGLLEPDNGVIMIDNRKLKDFDLRSFQSKIGYITQEPVIFSDTVFNNISFWDEKNEVNIRKFNDAIAKASLSDVIFSLREKEDALLGSNGVNLSGGQRQRISIARELYKDVEFLIMDEATSSLDTETEKAIQMNIDKLKGNYTIITIAHRLTTVKNADKIVLLKNGEIDKVGSFERLLGESDTFRRMVNLQEF